MAQHLPESLEFRAEVREEILLEVGLDDDSVDAGPEGAEEGGRPEVGSEEGLQAALPQAVDEELVVLEQVLRYRAVDRARQLQRVRNRLLHHRPRAQRAAR